jgi:hypothetical protein
MNHDTLKISVVWSKCPEPLRREMQRGGQLKDVQTWGQFERALRDAETATRSAPVPATPQESSGTQYGTARKRSASSAALGNFNRKKRDQRPPRQNQTPQFPSHPGSEASTSRPETDGKKNHWKQCSRGNEKSDKPHDERPDPYFLIF